jgi:hypothetical protein
MSTNPSLARQFVQPGACIATIAGGSKLATSCALEAQACSKTTGIAGVVSVDFVSSRQLKGHGSDHPGFSCLQSDHNDPGRFVSLGRCVAKDDAYVCTSDASNCKRPEVFEAQDEMCTLLADLSPTRIDDRAFFSSCLENGMEGTRRCFWARADCPQGAIHYGANPYSNFLLCPCEETETGACYDEATDDYVCAVSPDGCDSTSIFLSVHELKERANIDCRLCSEPTKIPEPLYDAQTPTWLESGSQGTVSPNNQGVSAQTSSSSSVLGRGGTITVSVTVGVVLGLFLAITIFWIQRHKRNKSAKGGTAIVVETLDVNRNENQEPQQDEVGEFQNC